MANDHGLIPVLLPVLAEATALTYIEGDFLPWIVCKVNFSAQLTISDNTKSDDCSYCSMHTDFLS